MRFRKRRMAPAAQHQTTSEPDVPPWRELLDPQERPTREDLGERHNVFADSLLEPVPMPRWLRGRRRAQRDRLN